MVRIGNRIMRQTMDVHVPKMTFDSNYPVYGQVQFERTFYINKMSQFLKNKKYLYMPHR